MTVARTASTHRVTLLSHGQDRDVVAWRGGVAITRAQCTSDSARLAATIGGASDPRGAGSVINLCSDRYLFFVALAAAAAAGRETLLPSSHSEQMLHDMLAAAPGSLVLADGPIATLASGSLEPIRVDALMGSAAETRPDARGSSDVASRAVCVDAEQNAIVAFTSGSTGVPTPHRKRWGSLATSAIAESVALALDTRGAAHDRPAFNLLGTVPPQHMYGIESTVLLATFNRGAFAAERPLLPADVARVLAQLPEPRVLVTTPVHIRALLASGVALAPLSLVLSAAAPLDAAMAAEAEARWRAPVKEIYGFTEAGQVASRRTTEGDTWVTLPGVHVEVQDGANVFSGGHIASPQRAADIVECESDTRFVLRGRSQDLLNIAGKRASLADLNRRLLSIDGVRDGAFHLPHWAGTAAPERLMAFVVAPGLTAEAIVARLRRELDPVFLPRPLVFCEALPRNATGKLPVAALVALEHEHAARARERTAVPRTDVAERAEDAEAARPMSFVIAADHPSLPGHFPGQPVVPGVLVLAHALALAPADARARGLQLVQAKFMTPLMPGEPCQVQWNDAGTELVCSVGERVVARAQWRSGQARAQEPRAGAQ